MVRNELVVTELRGWTRAWSYVVNCVFSGEDGRPTETLFLNMERTPGSVLPGVLFEVSETELGLIDEREYGYTRIDVTSEVSLDNATVYSYVASPGFDSPTEMAIIPARYFRTVSEGARDWGADFERSFWATTLPHTYAHKDGVYGPYYPPT